MFIVYAIKSELDGRIYVGMTNDLARRIKEHESGKTRSTKGYRPWKLIYSQSVDHRDKARELEKKLKAGSGKEFLKSVVKFAPVAQLDRAPAF